MLMKMVVNMLLRGLGPINGWKTWAGLGLAVINVVASYFDVVPEAIPPHLLEIIPTALIGLGLGDKMGKERAANGKKPVKK